MEKEFNIQVSKEHYSQDYDHLNRFISYYTQIDLVRSLKPNNVLEIGVGNKTVSNYLNNNGIKVDTCDFDKELNPDFVADIRDLPFNDNSYDLIIAFEIIEHLPWEGVSIALSELHRVSKKHVIISIPYASLGFELVLKFPFIRTILRRRLINCAIRIPLFFKKIKFEGQHYWEMGLKNYSKKKIRNKFIESNFRIIKESSPILNSNHYFFVLEKININ